MFDFSGANDAQKQAIRTTEGPVLITAGPGTGKTFTLVQRALYMIQENHVRPEQILMATFTEKAAKELITRISNELEKNQIAININEMYIGTFHSICLRIIKEHLEYTRIKKNYRTLDDFDQKYMVFQNINKFRSVPGFDAAISSTSAWDQAKDICFYVNNLTEELVSADDLIRDTRTDYSAMGCILQCYNTLLADHNFLDFSGIQKEAYLLLNNNPEVLESIREKIQYLMIDEYQDTNYIQELLVFLLAGSRKNICVVGDDDQGLYRFRGATIRNILEFPQKFNPGECQVIPLVENYRSNSDIVDFYNKWMKTTSGASFRFEWQHYRFDKTIIPHNNVSLPSPAVVKITASDDEEEWCENNYKFIRLLADSGKIKDLNQIAFLFNSVKNSKAVHLANYLESHGINVYSPRSDMFFERDEIKLLLGSILLCFPQYVRDLHNKAFKFLDMDLCRYYESCIMFANAFLVTPEGKPLLDFIHRKGLTHASLTENTDYAFSGLVYQMFEFAPFANILGVDMNSGVIDLRPARNISLITSILCKYEYLHRVDIFSPSRITRDVELFFNMFMKYLMRGGLDEYEDDSEYAPSGCVSFLTIHQSKGMEFPIVIVGSLYNIPRNRDNGILDDIAVDYYKRPAYEPLSDIKFFDFWRLYYTAFSRAQNLLVLTANEKHGRGAEPSKYFADIFDEIPSYESDRFDINDFDFAEVKDVNLKDTYSFTSHIAVYEECSLQYKFFKELGFTPIRIGATIFGTLIHETIEDIHRAALRNEEHLITKDNIQNWLYANYATISQSEHAYLGQAQIEAALKQVERYADRQSGKWDVIREAEVEVSLVKQDYIIEGKIDLIRGEGDTVQIVDFKSEKKPDLVRDYDRIQQYKKQLQVYAHLVEERTGHPVSKLLLYYTGEEFGVPVISFNYNKEDVSETIKEFDDIVHKIKSKDFSCKSKNQKTCDNCDFKHYCSK